MGTFLICFGIIALWILLVVIYETLERIEFKRVGGITFFKLGRWQGSFSRLRKK